MALPLFRGPVAGSMIAATGRMKMGFWNSLRSGCGIRTNRQGRTEEKSEKNPVGEKQNQGKIWASRPYG